MSDYEREIGEMTAKIYHLESTVTEMRADIRIIRDTLSEAKGGWKTVMIVAGISATIGGLLAKLAPFLSIFPR